MRLIVAIFFLPIVSLAAELVDPVSKRSVLDYLTAFKNAGGETSAPTDKVISFLDRLSEKRSSFRNDQLFLGHVFTKTHQRFLKQFKPYARFDQLLTNGDYNCLTGTALYALVLDHLGFEYAIVETNYHIFLLVESENGKVLFETTDQLRGFVTGSAEIEKRIETYRQDNPAAADKGKIYYAFNASVYNSIGLENLLGLMHYNLAVEAFNNHNLVAAVDYLEQAAARYESPRMDEFANIIMLSVLEGKLSPEAKEKLLTKVRNLRDSRSRIIASAKIIQ